MIHDSLDMQIRNLLMKIVHFRQRIEHVQLMMLLMVFGVDHYHFHLRLTELSLQLL